MNFNRRSFIKTAGTAAAAGLIPLQSISSLLQSGDKKVFKPVVVILNEPGFPSGELSLPSNDILQSVLSDFDVRFLNLKELKEQLKPSSVDLYLHVYGSYFPKEAWGTLIKYLKGGGNWVHLGGVPFSIPVIRSESQWRKEIVQTAYHKKLGFTQAFPVETQGLEVKGLGKEAIKTDQVYELYCRFTETRDFPNEDGPAGARDANLRALCYCISKEGKNLAAPLIQIDRMQGDYSGGRWILANFKGTIAPAMIRILVERAVHGAGEITVRSSFACYHPGEIPSLTVQCRRPKGNVVKRFHEECEVEIFNEKQKRIERTVLQLHGDDTVATGYWTTKVTSYSPGLYSVKVKQRCVVPGTEFSEELTHVTGFWVYNKKLMESGKPFTVDETYLLQEGKPYPVTGTTYMGSDVHRKFLFEPNPYLWNKDFATMDAAGINMVRTGIWTAWKNYMLDVGAPGEVALRSVDAFILTAKKYNIPVIFTFFAFLPETWGGENPYLDPRSINAQKEFITAFAQRYKNVPDIIWDFINEPSFCNPQQLWSCRPNYDRYEAEAWRNWLKKRYPAASDEERATKLQEIYRTTADDALGLPSLEEFGNANIFNEQRPVKVVDYRLFAQDMFREWTQEMTKAIRSNGNPHQLITVGQDEGGTSERPSPQFFSDAVDFTCLHNWWYNDDLLWDAVMTKAPGKPNLVEETGVMFYEKVNGSAWRTEQEVANLLERKLAFSLGAGGAGFIEWIWNTNPYMKSDNEAAIGLHRIDGTAKPELKPVSEYARFIAHHKHLMIGRVDEEVVMVIPHSQIFSTRNFGTEATQKCVRTIAYHCRVPLRAVSEYRLSGLKNPPRLLVVPSPRVLTEEAWVALLSLAEKGSTVLLTGAIDADEHWMPAERSKQIGFPATTVPIVEEEFLSVGRNDFKVSFRGDKLQRLEKAVIAQSGDSLVTKPHGKGTILWCPLPVELSDGVTASVLVYRHALQVAGVESIVGYKNDDLSVLIIPTIYSDTMLYTCISESVRDTEFDLYQQESKTWIRIRVPAQQTCLVFSRRSDGSEISHLIIE